MNAVVEQIGRLEKRRFDRVACAAHRRVDYATFVRVVQIVEHQLDDHLLEKTVLFLLVCRVEKVRVHYPAGDETFHEFGAHHAIVIVERRRGGVGFGANFVIKTTLKMTEEFE